MFYKKGKLYKIETEGLEENTVGKFIGIHDGRKVFSGTTRMKYENKVVERNVYIFLREQGLDLTDIEVITKKEFDRKANERINKLENKIKQ